MIFGLFRTIRFYLVCICCTITVGSYAQLKEDSLQINEFNHLFLGNPSNAITDTSHKENFLLLKKQYALSYNTHTKIPNWVSWKVDDFWLGKITRQGNFRKDTSLPSDWYHVSYDDYTKSGFDRGHLCPSADRTDSEEDNASTFFMTNIIPQAHENNSKTWLGLENYVRKLVEEKNDLYVIAGPYGKGGIGRDGEIKYEIGEGICVPEYVWKIILVIHRGENDLEKINTHTRVIAVWIPNTEESGKHPWYYYRVSVDFIEEKTGYDFFSKIDPAIQDEIESTIDHLFINEPIKKKNKSKSHQ